MKIADPIKGYKISACLDIVMHDMLFCNQVVFTRAVVLVAVRVTGAGSIEFKIQTAYRHADFHARA